MGVILYEMLTGKLPFTGPTPMAAMNDRLLNHPMPPTRRRPLRLPAVAGGPLSGSGAGSQEPLRQCTCSFCTTSSIWTRSASRTATSCANWQKRKSHLSRKILYYGALALIPVVILLLMMLIARHH